MKNECGNYALTAMILKNECGNYVLIAMILKNEWGNDALAAMIPKKEWGNYVLTAMILKNERGNYALTVKRFWKMNEVIMHLLLLWSLQLQLEHFGVICHFMMFYPFATAAVSISTVVGDWRHWLARHAAFLEKAAALEAQFCGLDFVGQYPPSWQLWFKNDWGNYVLTVKRFWKMTAAIMLWLLNDFENEWGNYAFYCYDFEKWLRQACFDCYDSEKWMGQLCFDC